MVPPRKVTWLAGTGSGTGRLKMSSSTLVETVSINYEDFSESFLTCSTCLCPYDSGERRPKLLSCSHTVCGSCLSRIADLPTNQQEGTIRCPICRELILIPRSGVPGLPPSFLVNQLIDLMQRQRRDVVPKCAAHSAEELLFCETCDTVFCPACSDPTDVSNGCHNHTIVPFSIAIKRMSEILLYKANQCVKNLNRATENVQREMDSLDGTVDQILDEVNASFQDLTQLVDRRRRELVEEVRRRRDDKRRVLQEQLGIIQAEKAKVEQDCNGLQYQVEVRNITRKISDLNQKLDTTLTLIEPRENAFLRYDCNSRDGLERIEVALADFGALSVSQTFPPLCFAEPRPAAVHLQSQVLLKTIDYNGRPRNSGGDPIEAKISWADPVLSPESTDIKVNSVDRGDGTYLLTYRAEVAGKYQMDIRIFGRPIQNSPLRLEVSPHQNPVWQFGSLGSDSANLRQPVRVNCGPEGQLLILDTGNNRLKLITSDGNFLRHHSGEGLLDQSAIGLACLERLGTGELSGFLTLNWRSRSVTEWTSEGREVKSFTFSEFVEPIDLAVDGKGRILVADNGARKVFVFDSSARPSLSFPVRALAKKSSPTNEKATTNGHVTCVAVGMNEDILVGSCGVQLYDSAGGFVRHIQIAPNSNSGGKLIVGGLAVSADGTVLATVIDRNRTYISVSDYKGQFKFLIDSFGAKLKRPSGICIAADGRHCLVAEVGNHCIKKFRFK